MAIGENTGRGVRRNTAGRGRGREITIKIKIKKEILDRLLPHPEGVTDGSRSVEARRDLRIGVRRMIAP
jgi:hypothetical protein